MEKYDVCVIGAGPAGYAAAMRAIDYKKKVILIEKKQLGGAGIHHGALSSKTWWELSREFFHIRMQSRSYNFDEPKINFAKVKAEVLAAGRERVDLLEHHMRNLNVSNGEDLFKFVHGNARLIDKHTVEITKTDNI